LERKNKNMYSGYAIKLKSLDEITDKSNFTENDAIEMDKIIKMSLRKHYEKEAQI
jgi:hypothetical protein